MKNNYLADSPLCDWQTVLKTVQGRRILFYLMQVAQLDQHGFVPNDALSTAFHCGQRSIGLLISRLVEKADPAAFFKMKEEYQAALEKKQAEIDREQEEL